MQRNNIGYHTRLRSDNTHKVVGGSFGGQIDMETINRLVSCSFSVVVKPSGRPVFVDKSGREVSLYISVDPDSTEVGKTAMKAYYAERDLREAKAQAQAEQEQSELEEALSGLSHEEILRRLKGTTA